MKIPRSELCMAGLALTVAACSSASVNVDNGTATQPKDGSALDGGVDVHVPEDPGKGGDAQTSVPDVAEAQPARPWRPFADDSPWNTKIEPSAGVDPTSQELIDALATSSRWPYLDIAIAQYSVPLYWVDADTPNVPVTVTRVAGEGFHENPSAPIPAGATPAAGTDRHLALVDRVTGKEWDFWQAAVSNGAWSCGVCATIETLGTGIRPFPQQGSRTWWNSHGARACGFPLSAGLITVEQIRSGHIDHALVLGYPGIRSRYYKSPASTAQATAPGISPDTGIPCGGRIQLDPGLDLERLGLSPSGRVVARALQEYGAFIGDYNGSISLYADASPDARKAWDGGLLATAELRNRVDLRSFRVLPIGTLQNDRN